MVLVLARTWKQFECWWRDNDLDRGELDYASVNTLFWRADVILLPGWTEGRSPRVVRDISIGLRDLECEMFTPEPNGGWPNKEPSPRLNRVTVHAPLHWPQGEAVASCA